MRRITELNRRCPLIVFVNDDPRIEGMVRAGIRREDAIEYTVLGCNEWAICGKSKLDLAHINMMHSYKTLLWDRREEALKAETYEDFYRLWEEMAAKGYMGILHSNLNVLCLDWDGSYRCIYLSKLH